MKNKIFDRKLYLESLRRTSVIGGLFTVLLTVASLLVFISHSTRPNYYLIPYSGPHTAVYMDFLELNPYMLLIPFTLTPLLCLNLFGFLNKRNSSDFWHSAPFTRSCIYNTFSLVNLTWSVIAAIVPLAISALCFAFIPDQYVIAWNSALPVMLSLLAAVLLVLAAGNIAMSLTGTYFSNVVLASLILFLPRLFIMFFANMATSSPLIIFNIENTVFSPYYNIVAGAVFGFGRFIETITSYTSICYTAVLAAIYYALGMWLFARRKSESAGHSTTSRHMQSIIRIVVCLVACLFPIYLATDYINSAAYNSKTHFSDWFTVLVLYVVAIAAYFIYELIATRKVKNLVKAIPGLLIVAAINVVVIGSAHLIYRAEYSYTPTPENVEEIRLYDIAQTSFNNRYFDKISDKFSVSDDEIEQILGEAFSNSRKYYETGDSDLYGSVQVKVGFMSNGVYRYRNIMMKDYDYQILVNKLYEHKDYRDMFDIESIAEQMHIKHMHFNFPFYGEDASIPYDAIMAAYIEDVKEMEFSTWQQIISKAHTNDVEINFTGGYRKFGKIAATIDGTIMLDGEEVSITLPISSFTPKAYNLVMELIAADQEEQNAQQDLLDAMKEIDVETFMPDDKTLYHIYVELYNGIEMRRPEEYSVARTSSLTRLIEVLESAKGTYPKANERLAIIHYSELIKEDKKSGVNEYDNHVAVFRIPEDAYLGFLISDYLDTY